MIDNVSTAASSRDSNSNVARRLLTTGYSIVEPLAPYNKGRGSWSDRDDSSINREVLSDG